MRPANRWMQGTEIPASLGVQGPGEMMRCEGKRASIASKVI